MKRANCSSARARAMSKSALQQKPLQLGERAASSLCVRHWCTLVAFARASPLGRAQEPRPQVLQTRERARDSRAPIVRLRVQYEWARNGKRARVSCERASDERRDYNRTRWVGSSRRAGERASGHSAAIGALNQWHAACACGPRSARTDRVLLPAPLFGRRKARANSNRPKNMQRLFDIFLRLFARLRVPIHSPSLGICFGVCFILVTKSNCIAKLSPSASHRTSRHTKLAIN